MLLVEDDLTAEAVRRVATGDVLAVRIVEYCQRELCEKLASLLVDSLIDDGRGHERIYQSNVCAFTETVNDETAQKKYLSHSALAMAALREACGLYMSPIDRLRCEFDEIWPGGATLLRVDGRPLVFGMLRVWRNGAHALPHIDILSSAAPMVAEARTFTGQLGVNIYLRMPSDETDEGLVEIWDIGMADADERQHGVTGTYGYRRELLADPAVVVRPATGDLLLLRSSKVHAVRPTTTGHRVTLSGFVGHVSAATPLRLWS